MSNGVSTRILCNLQNYTCILFHLLLIYVLVMVIPIPLVIPYLDKGEKEMLQETGVVRKVDELGRIVLPIEVRRTLGVEEKDSLAILTDLEQGQIVLKKVSHNCFKCNTTENLKMVKQGFYLCDKCIDGLQDTPETVS